jgi:hypothetical protein
MAGEDGLRVLHVGRARRVVASAGRGDGEADGGSAITSVMITVATVRIRRPGPARG